MGLGQVLAVGALALEQVRDRVEAEAVEPEVEPEAQHVEHRVLDLRVVVVEVGLVGEEPVPVVLAGDRVPGPVRGLGVDEDDPGVLVAVVGVRPHVPVALRRPGRRVRERLEPWVLDRGVVHHQVGDHPDLPRVRRVDQLLDVVDRPVVGVDLPEVGDVVAAVAQRRLVERQQPDAVDPEPLQVVELLGQAAEVADPVAVGVVEAAYVDLVEDRVLEPQRLGFEPLPGEGLRVGLRLALGGHRARAGGALGGEDVGQGGRSDAHASTLSTCACRTPGSSRT